MLLALAPPEKIIALGPFARDPKISFFAERAQHFPQVAGRTEELLNLVADAVAVGPFDNKFMRAALERREITRIVVDRWNSLEEVRRGVQTFAQEIGEVEKGALLVGEIDAAIASLRETVTINPAPSFLLLHRRGLVGESAVVSEILERAGLRNAARGSPTKFMSAEAVLALRPTLLVVTERNLKAEDRGLELLGHPALRRMYPERGRLTAPDRLTACPGPSTPDLIRHLKGQLRSLSTRR